MELYVLFVKMAGINNVKGNYLLRRVAYNAIIARLTLEYCGRSI